MDQDTFVSELRRMASNNGILLVKEKRIAELANFDGADFINIFPGSDKNEVLVVTSLAVHALKASMLSFKDRWHVELDDITSVEPQRRVFNRYVIDEIVVRT